jgi:signal transduction histidine kinase
VQATIAASDRRELVRTVELDNGFVELMVEDSGKGIAEGDLARVFEPFFSTKPEGLGVPYECLRRLGAGFGDDRSFRSDGLHGVAAHP